MKPNYLHSSASVLAGLALVALTGCQVVPETGRSQLVLISGAQEAQLGLQSFSDAKSKVPVSKDARANELVQKVGKRIAAVASKSLPNAQWEFVVFESGEANAFCLPGGKVGVHTGILPITRDEAGLAAVIGHEVAHAVARHGAERMSEAMVMQAGGEILGAAMSSADPRWQAVTALAYGVGTQMGRELPHSRSQESEADNIGLTYMARAGYDPQEAVKFWERFAEYGKTRGGNSTLSFLRTHPTDETRIRQLQELMPKAQEEYLRAKTGQ